MAGGAVKQTGLSKEEANKRVAELEKVNAELNQQLAKAQKSKAKEQRVIAVGSKSIVVLKEKFSLGRGVVIVVSELEKDKKQLEATVTEVLKITGQTIFAEEK